MILRTVKVAVSAAYWIAGEGFSLLSGRRDRFRRPVILTYHSVTGDRRPRFEKHMDMLLSAGVPSPLPDDVISPPGRRRISLTFDDGFADFFTEVVPVLREKGIPATVFVTTGGPGAPPSWIRDGRHPNANLPLMSRQELASLPRDLVTIGSHTVSHPRLGRLPDSRALDELATSRNTLVALLGQDVTLLSLPYGDFREPLLRMAGGVGYDRVYLNVPATARRTGGVTLYGRISTDCDDWHAEFFLKVRGAYDWMSWAVPLKRRVRAWAGGSREATSC